MQDQRKRGATPRNLAQAYLAPWRCNLACVGAYSDDYKTLLTPCSAERHPCRQPATNIFADSRTHIIAPVLPPSKHVAFADYKVVKPAWIVASVEANQVLDWRRWKLVPTGGELESAQKGMDRFLAKGSSQAASAKSLKANIEESIPITTLPIPPRPPDPVLPGHDSISVYEDDTEDVGKPQTPVKQTPVVADNSEAPRDVSNLPEESAAARIASPTTPSTPSKVAIAERMAVNAKEVAPARAKQPYKNPWANYFKFEQNPDAQRLMKDDTWQQKHTAQAGNEFIEGYYQNSRSVPPSSELISAYIIYQRGKPNSRFSYLPLRERQRLRLAPNFPRVQPTL